MPLIFDVLSDTRPHKGESPLTSQVRDIWREKSYSENLTNTPKYVFNMDVIVTAAELGSSCPDPDIAAFSPAWVEWDADNDLTLAVLLGDRGEAGLMFLYNKREGTLYDFTFTTYRDPMLRVRIKNREAHKGRTSIAEHAAAAWVRVIKAIALLQSPGLLDVSERHGADEKLQKARIKAGKRPLVDFREVVIHISRQEREARERAADYEKRTGKRLHRVRSFVRMRLGKLERVREHWRGDASNGAVGVRNYRVKL